MSKTELSKLINLVRHSKPKTVADVQVIVERYFNSVVWSLLKEEYEVFMTEQERLQFLRTVFEQVQDSNST